MNNQPNIRAMVQQEIESYMSGSRFGLKNTTRHTHNGIDSAQINAANIVPGRRTSGSVEFDNAGKSYTFNTNFQPSLVTFYGNPYHSSGGIDIHSFVFGQAALGQNLYFQPISTSSVGTGGQLDIVQTCTSFVASGSGSGTSFATIASQEHLINVQTAGGVVARATVTSYGPSSFTITVDTLASGWTIVGNYFVS